MIEYDHGKRKTEVRKMALDMNLSIIVPHAADLVKEAFTASGITAELVDFYESTSENAGVMVMTFEKFFYRNSSRASLTVAIDNLRGYTRLHAAGSGGGGVFWKFDWGAKDNMENVIYSALARYTIK